MNWILFGFKSVGKTTAAKHCGLPWIDTDQLIEEKIQMPIRDFVLKNGEPIFRSIEQKIIQGLHCKNKVIATGGGALLNPSNLAHLQSIGLLIHLRGDKEMVKKRILQPLLPTFLSEKNPAASFEKIYSQTIEKYETISTFQIDMGTKTPQEIGRELWLAINTDKFFGSQPGENHTGGQLV